MIPPKFYAQTNTRTVVHNNAEKGKGERNEKVCSTKLVTQLGKSLGRSSIKGDHLVWMLRNLSSS